MSVLDSSLSQSHLNVFLLRIILSPCTSFSKEYSFAPQAREALVLEQNMEAACRKNATADAHELDITECMQRGMSPHCYSELYASDAVRFNAIGFVDCEILLATHHVLPMSIPQVEDGEIDLRFSSFRGCVARELQSRVEQSIRDGRQREL